MADTLTVLGPADVRRWFEQGLRSLLAVRRQVDVLNVFPVPDGDTGTNLVLTLAAAARAAGRLDAGADLTTLTAAAARGALVGARGNSGVILSQAMRGLARSVAGREALDGPAAAAALAAAAHDARQAVARPVEGTVLTVAEAAARAAVGSPDPSLTGVVTAAAHGAARALTDTRSQLPVLAERGVVDAGAAGYTILLEALVAVVDGAGPATARAREALASLPAPRPAADGAACALGAGVVGAGDGGDVEVMYVLHATAREAAAVRVRLEAAGESVAVVGGSEGAGERGLWQVHVHTATPTAVLTAGAEQVCARSLTVPPSGVVACTRLPGLVAPLAATGAVVVLHPDPAGLERGVVDAGAREVLLLPCDDASAALADGTPLSPQRVLVAATRSEPAVLAVAAEQRPGASAAERVAAADDAAGRVRTATCTAGGLEDAVAHLVRPGDELLTAVVGSGAAGEDVAERLHAAVAAHAPDAEVLLLDAGVPEPEILLGAQ